MPHPTGSPIAACCIAAALASLLAACGPSRSFPDPASKEYGPVVTDFQVGLAALQVGDDLRAQEKLTAVTQAAPGEPAGWADLGVLALRQRNVDVASERLQKAQSLVPDDAHIHRLLGTLESVRGRSAEAIVQLRRALELDPADLRARYALAQEIERQGGADSDAQVEQALRAILAARPDNLAAWLELCRIAARRGESDAVKEAIAHVAAQSAGWPDEAREQLAALQAQAASGDARAVGTRTTMLRNVLWRVPEFRESYAVIKAPAGEEALPYRHFLRMANPTYAPAPPDTALAFEAVAVTEAGNGPWQWAGAIQLGGEGRPVAAWADARELRLANGATVAFPGGTARAAPGADSVLQLDFDYDFKTDLVLAGAGGVRLYRQEAPNAFVDSTAKTGLPAPVLAAAYTGAWAADIEADGDLDVVLGTRTGPPPVLRNNGDGTFTLIHPFGNLPGVAAFAWADLDGDGVPDAAMIDVARHLHVMLNMRQGQFREQALPAEAGEVLALTIADMDADGALDLVVLRADGAILRISGRDDARPWTIATIAQVPAEALASLAGGARLGAADLDNNGAVDLYVAPLSAGAMARVWLGDAKGALTPLARSVGPVRVFDAADLGGGGRLDLVGVDADGRVVRAASHGSRNYHWQVVRPRAAQAVGDQRINPFGVGGEVEIRAGFMVAKQLITGPQLHFGLGEQLASDVVRVVWPNGAVAAEFATKADQEVVTVQRLKGSCPFMFAWDGHGISFVKDSVPWSSAIGLRINNLGSASIVATEEWYKIRNDQLVPRDGYYDIRFTAELWEVYYYDWLALTTVDHPAGTEIFIDERFVIPPAKLAITAVATPHPIARATDDMGQDVTEIVSKVDGRAVDSFGRGQYQGVTRDHYLEVDLGEGVPDKGPLYLIAQGSVYPTDSSINVALSQGSRWQPHPVRLEVPDGKGGWKVARENMGFPAGRRKDTLIDLTGLFVPGAPHRVRLRTTLEVYWDAITWAQGLPDTPLRVTRIDPDLADLHYRGYSAIHKQPSGGIEFPDYNQLEGSKQRWRDSSGYYTRYGDVRELLKKIDDRYVIMSSGDEMTFRFREQPAPQAGFVRDFVIMGDGWIKDGDYNSTFSKTVQPLPYHAEHDYTKTPGRLEDEVPFRMHPEDWFDYHTRYVTGDVFVHALREPGGE